MAKIKIKKGDQVIVIAGRDKGKKGEVLKALPAENRVVVAGINMIKKHEKPGRLSAGGIISKEASIHISNIAHIDPKSGRATRTGAKISKDGKKTLVAKKSGEDIR